MKDSTGVFSTTLFIFNGNFKCETSMVEVNGTILERDLFKLLFMFLFFNKKFNFFASNKIFNFFIFVLF